MLSNCDYKTDPLKVSGKSFCKMKYETKDYSVVVNFYDRNKDTIEDLVILYLLNKDTKHRMRQKIIDFDFDNIADMTFIDCTSKKGYGFPDGKYDLAFTTKQQCKALFNKKPTKENLKFSNFLYSYLQLFE